DPGARDRLTHRLDSGCARLHSPPERSTAMRHLRQPLLFLLLALCALPALATMRADPVEWTLGETTFRGVLVYDDANAIERPGLVMVPDWMGMTDAAIAKAKHIAGNDYVVLVA